MSWNSSWGTRTRYDLLSDAKRTNYHVFPLMIVVVEGQPEEEHIRDLPTVRSCVKVAPCVCDVAMGDRSPKVCCRMRGGGDGSAMVPDTSRSVKSVQSVKSVASVKSTKSEQSVKSVKSVQSVKSNHSVGSVRSNHSVGTVKSNHTVTSRNTKKKW